MSESVDDFIDRITEEIDEFVMQCDKQEEEDVYGGIEYNMGARLSTMKINRED